MITIIRTDANNIDFINLVKKLDADLAARDGDDHSFYKQFNKIDTIPHAIVAYLDNLPIGCGAIKQFDTDKMEVKRMFTDPAYRGKGVARLILKELEKWTKALSYKKCILETGKRQPEAIALYKKSGYHLIQNYGQYKEVDNSLCFEKLLT